MSVLGLGALMLGSLAAGVAPVTAQDATPAMEECAATTPEENKALVNEFFAAVDGGDVSGLVAEDLVYHDPSGEGPGDDEAQEWADERQEDFPDVALTVDLQVAEGDMVASYLTWTGTHQDDDEEMGVPATGMQAEWVGVAFHRIECGRIAEVWSVSDDLGRLQDLGVISDEELQSAETMATPEA